MSSWCDGETEVTDTHPEKEAQRGSPENRYFPDTRRQFRSFCLVAT